jgi:ADP-ribose pyrophosphatase YjhB (NUDIX family)
MLSFDAGPWRFHLRAAAVVRDGDFLLLHRLTGDPFWALPGGRVEAGETAQAAIEREMYEELGVRVRAGSLSAVVENFFTYRERPQHGVELHFDVDLPEGCPLLGRAPFERVEDSGTGLNGEVASQVRLEFRWFHVSELDDLDLRPSFLRQSLASVSQPTTHVVHDDNRPPWNSRR